MLDLIFIRKYMVEKHWKVQDLHALFVDFKLAYGICVQKLFLEY